jgi:hypothetical protein
MAQVRHWLPTKPTSPKDRVGRGLRPNKGRRSELAIRPENPSATAPELR